VHGEDVEVVSAFHSLGNHEFAKYEYATTSVTILKFKDGRVGKVASSSIVFSPIISRAPVGSEGSLLTTVFSPSLAG